MIALIGLVALIFIAFIVIVIIVPSVERNIELAKIRQMIDELNQIRVAIEEIIILKNNFNNVNLHPKFFASVRAWREDCMQELIDIAIREPQLDDWTKPLHDDISQLFIHLATVYE